MKKGLFTLKITVKNETELHQTISNLVEEYEIVNSFSVSTIKVANIVFYNSWIFVLKPKAKLFKLKNIFK